MLPHVVSCEECGDSATVRGYGRVEYKWDQTNAVITLQIQMARLTIDCPRCGVRVQEYHPAERDRKLSEGYVNRFLVNQKLNRED
jgi:5-methylcytosine-specific restriction endonuclease McrA